MAVTAIFSICVTALIAYVLYWHKKTFSYWQRLGIPFIKPTPIIGNLKVALTLKSSIGLFLSQSVYSDPKMSNEPVVGIYALHKPALVIREPELIKSILIKEFNKFSNRFAMADPHGDTLNSHNLFFAKNPHWKELRTKLSPMFSSGKLKQMYPLLLEIGAELERHLAAISNSENPKNIAEVKEICALFTTDAIATIAFGVRANSLQNPQAEFREQGRKIFQYTFLRSKYFNIAFFIPSWTTPLRVKLFTREFSKFLRNTISYVIENRERTGLKRNDLIDILCALKKELPADDAKPSDKGTKAVSDVLVAQAGLFFNAGFETSSAAMTFALYEMAKQPKLLKRLRAEICDAFVAGNGQISYENLSSLEYLDMVIDEVLRLYPTLPFLDRLHTKISNEPGFSLKPYVDFELPDNLPVFIPTYGLQHDAKYWSNPDEFNPEHFSKENRKLHKAMTYLPFGTGPHNCIGMRLGLLQAKIGLIHFLKNHYVTVCDKTIPRVVFDPKAFLLQGTTGIYLNLINDNLYEKSMAQIVN